MTTQGKVKHLKQYLRGGAITAIAEKTGYSRAYCSMVLNEKRVNCLIINEIIKEAEKGKNLLDRLNNFGNNLNK